MVYLNHYIRKIAVLKLKTQILDSLKKGKNIELLKLFNRLEEDYSLGFQLDLARFKEITNNNDIMMLMSNNDQIFRNHTCLTESEIKEITNTDTAYNEKMIFYINNSFSSLFPMKKKLNPLFNAMKL